jgi:hypothetical protein
MKYGVEMGSGAMIYISSFIKIVGSGAMIYISSFIKIGSRIQKFIVGDIH